MRTWNAKTWNGRRGVWRVCFVVLSACAAPESAIDASTNDADVVVDAGHDAFAAPDAGPRDAGFRDVGPTALMPFYPLEARFPEGGTYDPSTETFYVGSLADGTVHAIDARTGTETVLFRETLAGTWWTLGMDVDTTRHQLWVCAMDDRRALGDSSHPYDGYVWVFDLATGARIARHVLADAFPMATCTDVAVAADGTAYVCDRQSPNVYRISGDTVSTFATDSALSGSIVGQNAIVVLPDQSALLSLIYLPSRLVRIGLPDAHVSEVSITGDFFDGTPALSGADGMTLSNGALLVAFTSQLNRLTPTLGDWSAASSVSVDVTAGMTDVIHTPSGDYLSNGQSLAFALGSTPDPFELVRFDGTF